MTVHLDTQLEAVELFMREVRAIDEPAALLEAEISIRAQIDSSDDEERIVRRTALQLIREARLQLRQPKARTSSNAAAS